MGDFAFRTRIFLQEGSEFHWMIAFIEGYYVKNPSLQISTVFRKT